jgi:hypothetical protein
MLPRKILVFLKILETLAAGCKIRTRDLLITKVCMLVQSNHFELMEQTIWLLIILKVFHEINHFFDSRL